MRWQNALSACFAISLLACAGDLQPAECLQSSDCAPAELCVALQCVAQAGLVACSTPGPDGAELGERCGNCNNGVWACEEGEFVCFGQWQNQCGGCSLAPGELGQSCGQCDGAWVCDGDDFACSATTNLCGGCGSLQPAAAVIGQACEVAESSEEPDGVWLCRGPQEIACVSPDTNVCGGDASLDGVPGTPCGDCLGGVLTCRDANTIACCFDGGERCEADETRNLCGECSAIVEVPEAPCGECGQGTWQLDCEAGIAVCRDDVRNTCGGCAPLEGEGGDQCGDGGALACVAGSALVCTQGPATNACGGTTQLAQQPGDVCGPCGRGTAVCVGPDVVVCAGDVVPNECGVCAPALEGLGDVCGIGGVWSCATGDDPSGPGLQCSPPDGRDVCGGTTGAPQGVFDACGGCGGRWACDTSGELTCVVSAERAPRTSFRDSDSDGFGDNNDPGGAQCGDAEGYASRAGDCDDEVAAINPDSDEIPDNDRDDDCDPATPD